MDLQLPEDILHLICEELRQRQDFATLFNCAVSSKQLAPLALSNLYRMHTEVNEDEDETAGLHQGAQQAFMKWSSVWRSIILAAMGKTLYPYHAYLKCLDLRDLRSLLRDYKFRDKVSKDFFKGDLSHLRFTTETKGPRSGVRIELDLSRTLEAIGDLIVPATSTIEEVAGEFSSAALGRWVVHLPRLMRLDLYDGESLGNGETQQAIFRACPLLDSLRLFLWHSENADARLGAFIAGLRDQSLKAFVTIGGCNASTETCLALNRHNFSLHCLHLSFSPDAVNAIGLLKGCTSLTEVNLSFARHAIREDVLTEVIEWLRSCKQLHSISWNDGVSAPKVLAPLLVDPHLQLEEVLVEGLSSRYNFEDGRAFHQALMAQKGLRSLSLTADPPIHNETSHSSIDEDRQIFVHALCQLEDLRNLQLLGVPDFFVDGDLGMILGACSRLEIVEVGCLRVTDLVLEVLATLQHLRSMTFQGDCHFTTKGLLTFISKLGPGNSGLEVAIESEAVLVSDAQLRQIRKALHEEVQGRIDYVLSRNADASEFSDSDSGWD